MQKITIWHNPRCSKSRRALEILREAGVEPNVRLYLDDPPSEPEIREVLGWLGKEPSSLLRPNEDAYRAAGLDNPVLTLDAQVAKMSAFPQVIERPVVFLPGDAVIARPPETLLPWLVRVRAS